MDRPQRIAIIGLGGFAGSHHRAALSLEEDGVLQVIATCDPKPEAFLAQRKEWDFDRRGVQVFDHYLRMLDACADRLDWVVIATPIPLHAEMHAACRSRGLGVYLEKPPTLDPAELERMIEADRVGGETATNVGFNFIVQPERRALKNRILAGEFGAVREVRIFGSWGRATRYYKRNSWAGRLLGPNDFPILDSCFGNGMAHLVHNSLFWAGTGALQDFAIPEEVRAALFRAHSIESPDTVFAEAKSRGGVVLRYALTHASTDGVLDFEEVICDDARIRFVINSHCDIIRSGSENVERETAVPLPDRTAVNLQAYADYWAGKTTHPPTTLEESRPFVHLNALLYLSAERISRFPADRVRRVEDEKRGGVFFQVAGLAEAQNRFLESGRWPDLSSAAVLTPKTATPADLPRLLEAVRALQLETADLE